MAFVSASNGFSLLIRFDSCSRPSPPNARRKMLSPQRELLGVESRLGIYYSAMYHEELEEESADSFISLLISIPFIPQKTLK
jgi:hypothetical protein